MENAVGGGFVGKGAGLFSGLGMLDDESSSIGELNTEAGVAVGDVCDGEAGL